MRTGLIAANIRTPAGDLRAELMLAGRSVMAWQIDLMRALDVERIICLCDAPTGEILRLQHEVEGAGLTFQALKGFAALPALVRAEDVLVILRDGVVPDPAVVKAVSAAGETIRRMVMALPADHALVQAHPEDFERIDAMRHWAGLLVMRGAPVQQLADFPGDADPVSVLLRLALQAGTPCQMLDAAQASEGRWLLADSAGAVTRHEQALIASAAPLTDWRAPFASLATLQVQQLAPRGMAQGAQIAGFVALILSLTGVGVAGLGSAPAGLGVAAAGSFAGRIALAYAALAASLRRKSGRGRGRALLTLAVDGLGAATLWFALAPWPQWQPLAICGPLLIGLARHAETSGPQPVAALASDRTNLLAVLAVAAVMGVFPVAVAALCTLLLAALLLQARPN
jgi:hypothetical protein